MVKETTNFYYKAMALSNNIIFMIPSSSMSVQLLMTFSMTLFKVSIALILP